MPGTLTERTSESPVEVTPGQRKALRQFDIHGNNLYDLILTNPAWPAIGSPHNVISGVYCVRLAPRPVNSSPKHWLLEAFYETPSGFGEDGDPTKIPIKWDWDGSITTVRVDRDKDGNPLVNSAGEPFDGPTAEIPVIGVTGTKWIKGNQWNPATFMPLLNCVNSDPVTIQGGTFAAATLRINGIHPDESTINGTSFVKLAYKLQFNPLGFKLRFIDQGFSFWQFLGVSWARKPFLRDQQLDNKPHLLNGYGLELGKTQQHGAPPGATVKPNTAGALTVSYSLEYDWCPSAAFGGLVIFTST